MRSDKEKAILLRRQGKSYNQIKEIIGISKGTLSVWLKKENWSIAIASQNKTRMQIESSLKMQTMNKQRNIKLLHRYNLTRELALEEFGSYKDDPLFVAGIMLYSGEGDKTLSNGQIRVANIDFRVFKIFIRFAVKYLGLSIENIKFWILLYPELDERVCVDKWKQELGLLNTNFYKNQRIEGRSKSKRLIYGVGNITMGNKFLKTKLLEWLRLLSERLSK